MFERTLLLATLRVGVRSFDGEDRAMMERRYGAFEIGPADREILLDVRHDPDLRQLQPESVAWPGALAETLPDGSMVFAREGERLVVDAGLTAATLTMRRDPGLVTDAHADHRSAPPESALRILVASHLPSRDGAVFHAAGYADHRGAVIFPGASGVGKTTLAHKLPREHVLSDDQVAVVERVAHALPFVGDLGPPIAPRTAPLRAIAFLERSPGASLEPLSRVASILRATTCAPWFLRDRERSERWLQAVTAIASSVPCYLLRTRRDEPLAPLLDTLLTQ